MRSPVRSIPIAATLALAAALALTGCMGPVREAQPGEPVDSVDCLSPGLRLLGDLGIAAPLTEEAQPPAPEPGAIPDDFVPIEAVLCATDFGEATDGSMPVVVTQTRYSGDLSPLVEAINGPSDPPSTGACTMDYEIVPELFVVAETGEAIRAVWPVDGCNKTKPGIRTALAALEVVGEDTIPVEGLQTGGDPFAQCLSQLPPGGSVGPSEPAPEPTVTEPVPGETYSPDSAADAECG